MVSTKLGEAFVEVEARTDQLDRGYDRARRQTNNFVRDSQRSLGRIQDSFRSISRVALGVGVGATALATIARSALDAADQIDKLAISTNLSTERIQTLRFAADQLGVGADFMTASLERFNRRLGEFTNTGGGPAKQALEDLGLANDVLAGRFETTNDALDEVLNRLAAIPDPAQRAAQIAKLFGDEAGPKLSRALVQGSEGIRRLEQRAKDLGVVLEEDLIKSAVEVRDEWDALVTAMDLRFKRFVLGVIDGVRNISKSAEDIERINQGIRDQQIDDEIKFGRRDASGLRVEPRVGDLDVNDPRFGGPFNGSVGSEARPSPASAPRPDQLGRSSLRQDRERRAGGGGVIADTAATDLIARQRESLILLQQEIELVGKVGIERAELEAQFERERLIRELHNAAKREGSTISAEELVLGENLITMSGDLTVEIERQEQAIRDREQAQRDAADAARDAADAQRDLSNQLDNLANSSGDAIAGLITGTRNWRDILEDVLRTIIQISQQQLTGGSSGGGGIFGTLVNAVGGAVAGSFGGGISAPGAASSPFSTIPGLPSFFAKGGAFSGGKVVPFAQGGVISSPMTFPLSGGRTGLAGEAGPEAILPLSRGPGGELGVASPQAAALAPVVNLHNYIDPKAVLREGLSDSEGLTIFTDAMSRQPQQVRSSIGVSSAT
ncbi:MAG: hypothetical protein AAGC81_01845 [Pseudomonadota bacterium]